MDHTNYGALNQELDKVKGGLFFKKGSGFLGALLCKLEFQWRNDIDTAATDGEMLYWNPEFFASLSREVRITVLAHELWHVAFLHMFRRGNRDPEIWNIAADFVINDMLHSHGYNFENQPHLHDIKYRGWSTEQVYDELIQHAKKLKLPVGGIGKDIMDPGSDKKDKAVSNVVSARNIARMTGQAGDIPGEISLTIDKFLNPKLPWEQLLYQFFDELTDLSYTFRRPNRRYTDPILPGLAGMEGLEHLIYYLDISGSIRDEDILRFNSEVKFIKDHFQPAKLTLVTFDTKLRDRLVMEQDEEFEKITVTGRGGTSLSRVWNDMQKEKPSAAVIFTDLLVNIPPEDPRVPLIWVCLDNPNATVPFGRLIHLNGD